MYQEVYEIGSEKKGKSETKTTTKEVFIKQCHSKGDFLQ